jgi:hypothetical protein
MALRFVQGVDQVKIRYLLLILFVLLFGAVIFLFRTGDPRVSGLISSVISVSLVGQTNDGAGTTFFIFEATNAAPRGWKVSYQTQIPGPTAYPPKSQQNLFVMDAPLAAQSVLRFAFPAPQEAVPTWRVVLFYEDPPAPWRGRVNKWAAKVGASKRVVDDFPRKFAYSPALSNP